MGIAVQVGLERHTFFDDLSQSGKAEDLITAGIGQDRTGPRDKFVQTAEFTDQVGAGAEEEVVRVAENDRGAQFFPQIALREPFDRSLRSDGHENRGGYIAVFGVQNTGTGPCFRALGEELEDNLTRQNRL